MSIPASNIVNIVPRIISTGGLDLEINGLMLAKTALIPSSDLVMEFSTAAEVSAYFGVTSSEYAAARVYFKGYDNSFKKPSRLFIGLRVDEDLSAWLRGAAYKGTLEELQKVKDGSLNLSINGKAAALTALDFSDASSFSATASVIQTALAEVVTGATVNYSALTNAFQITSPTKGTESAITFTTPAGGTDVGGLLNLTQETGAVISQGITAMAPSENLEAINNKTSNWVTFTTLYDVEDSESLALSAWASSKGTDYAYIAWSLSAAALINGSSTDAASKLKAANAASTAIVYGTATYAVFIMGTAASIDWNRINGVITFAFKSQSGLMATVTDGTDATVLLNKGYNIYGDYATRNDNFIFLYDGKMFGEYNYLDAYINAVWLNNAFQVALMSGLKTASAVPYNDDGYSLIRSWLMDPILRGVDNGVITPNVNLSEAQKGELMREAGLDISGDIETDGWYLQIEDASASVRTNRDTPTISFWYAYGGSVQKISMASILLA